MQTGLVTVVLPIYNVEKYLDECIGSIVGQTYSDLEIILIDDGSTDSSPRICDDWAERDSRIRVVHKENQGQGIARNVGIEMSNGEYICFFDSDDYIELSAIEKLYALASNEKSDIVVFGLNSVDQERTLLATFPPKVAKKTYSGEEVLNDFFPEFLAPDPNGDGSRSFYMSSCLLMYSTELIKRANWKYVSEREIISEDVYSLIALFKYVNKVSILPEALYNYRQNDASFSHVYRADRYEKIRFFYTECVDLARRLGYEYTIEHRVSKPYLAYTISTLKQEAQLKRQYKETRRAIKNIVCDDVLQAVLRKNKNDKVSTSRKVLFFAMRNRMIDVCILLLKAKI